MNVCMSRAAGAEKIWDFYISGAHNRSGGTGMLLLGWGSGPPSGWNAPARGGITDVRKRTPPLGALFARAPASAA